MIIQINPIGHHDLWEVTTPCNQNFEFAMSYQCFDLNIPQEANLHAYYHVIISHTTRRLSCRAMWTAGSGGQQPSMKARGSAAGRLIYSYLFPSLNFSRRLPLLQFFRLQCLYLPLNCLFAAILELLQPSSSHNFFESNFHVLRTESPAE